MHVPYNRGGLRSYLMLLGLLAGRATPFWIAWGTPFLLIGIALRLWAKGCLYQNMEVTNTGPYRFVRHPFYLGNALIDFGIVIMSGWWLLQLALPLWWLSVYIPTIRREEDTMEHLFGETYRAYQSRVPMLIPWRRPLPESEKGFSWHNPNIARTEIPRTVRFLSYPLMFVIVNRLHSQGIAAIPSPTVWDVLTVSACVALYAVQGELRWHFRYNRPILGPWTFGDTARLCILLSIIVTGLCVTKFEVECDWIVWPLGVLLLTLSMVARKRGRSGQVISEAVLTIGLSVLFELVWLAILLVPVYLAILLDGRFPVTFPSSSKTSERPFSFDVERAYGFLLTIGVVLTIAKELAF